MSQTTKQLVSQNNSGATAGFRNAIIKLTTTEKLAASGLTVEEVKTLLGLK